MDKAQAEYHNNNNDIRVMSVNLWILSYGRKNLQWRKQQSLKLQNSKYTGS